MQRLWQDQRGTAMTEALLVIPVLLLVWWGLFFMNGWYSQRQQARLEARRCAWLYAEAGCREVPPGCEGSVHKGGSTGAAAAQSGAVERDLIEKVQRIKGLGFIAESVFGTSTIARKAVQQKRPAYLGGGERRGSEHIDLLCNEPERSPMDIVKSVARRFSKLFGG
ncbi:MAG: hypothetical protein ACPGUV_12425 [Polyangiales bacterium]